MTKFNVIYLHLPLPVFQVSAASDIVRNLLSYKQVTLANTIVLGESLSVNECESIFVHIFLKALLHFC